MEQKIFFDEIRSWRYPATYVFLVGSTILASVGGWLMFAAASDAKATMAVRLIIGGVFGAGFFLLFGSCAIVLLLRLLKSPCRVRMDTEGVQIGTRRFDWSQVQRLSFKVVRGEGWLTIHTATPFLVPGEGLPAGTWSALADQLKRHFKHSNWDINIEISVVKVR